MSQTTEMKRELKRVIAIAKNGNMDNYRKRNNIKFIHLDNYKGTYAACEVTNHGPFIFLFNSEYHESILNASKSYARLVDVTLVDRVTNTIYTPEGIAHQLFATDGKINPVDVCDTPVQESRINGEFHQLASFVYFPDNKIQTLPTVTIYHDGTEFKVHDISDNKDVWLVRGSNFSFTHYGSYAEAKQFGLNTSFAVFHGYIVA